jgi:hypothetical protein
MVWVSFGVLQFLDCRDDGTPDPIKRLGEGVVGTGIDEKVLIGIDPVGRLVCAKMRERRVRDPFPLRTLEIEGGHTMDHLEIKIEKPKTRNVLGSGAAGSSAKRNDHMKMSAWGDRPIKAIKSCMQVQSVVESETKLRIEISAQVAFVE